MNTTILEAVNRQVQLEFEAAFLYLSMSAALSEHGMSGAGRWMRAQYHEECGHALKLVSYLERRRAPVRLTSLHCPPCEWESPLVLFQRALEHERLITQEIHELVTLCRQERDYATQCLLFEYVREQVEEEYAVEEIVDALTLCGDSAEALMRLDAHLGMRSCREETGMAS